MTKRMTLEGSLLGIAFDLEMAEHGKNSVTVKGSIWGKPIDLVATVKGKSFKVYGSLLGEVLKIDGSDETEEKE
jgi:hypothetical protein